MKISELNEAVSAMNFDTRGISIGSGLPDADEKYCIAKEGNHWEVYYAEKGQKGGLRVFRFEDAACRYFLAWANKDELLRK